MKLAFRVLALLLVVPSTYYFIYWVPFAFISIGDQRWIASIVSLACAIGVGWYVWTWLGLETVPAIPRQTPTARTKTELVLFIALALTIAQTDSETYGVRR